MFRVSPRSCDPWMNTYQCKCVSGPPVGMHLHECMSVLCLYALIKQVFSVFGVNLLTRGNSRSETGSSL